MKKMITILMALAIIAGTMLMSPVASACEKCKEKAPDSCGDGCLLPDGNRTS